MTHLLVRRSRFADIRNDGFRGVVNSSTLTPRISKRTRTVNRKPALVILAFLLGCSAENNTQVFVDPATGEEAAFEFSARDNWKLYSAYEGKALILERSGKPVAFIDDFGLRRTLSIASEYDAPVVLTLTDEDVDGRYDTIKYGNGTVEVTDIGLDGVIDILLNHEEEKMLVNYQGELAELLRDERGEYIIYHGTRIDMEFDDGAAAPPMAR